MLKSASPERAVVRAPAPRRRAALRATPGGDVDPEPRSSSGAGWIARRAPAASVVPIIEELMALGPVLIVTPSVDRARLAAARLRALGSVALLPNDWALALGGTDLTIGARSAAWASVPDLAAIIVLDEHDEALQEERSPTWHARDVCLERARRAGIPCVLVSPTPSLAALHGGLELRLDDRRTERLGWPHVEVIDLGADDPWITSLVTSPLIQELRTEGRRVACIHNTTGRARRLACKRCRELSVCEACATPVAERTAGVLTCPRCGTERPKVCQACGAAKLVNLRPGVSRLREELEAAAGRPVIEVTAATDDLPDDADVFVGTEALLHRVRRLDTVAFVDFDAELLARYRAGEQALGLLAHAARLVGCAMAAAGSSCRPTTLVTRSWPPCAWPTGTGDLGAGGTSRRTRIPALRSARLARGRRSRRVRRRAPARSTCRRPRAR
ncbi:MAG: hypothetical protein R2715_09685 [Ilumatobacteraceae bacterium]